MIQEFFNNPKQARESQDLRAFLLIVKYQDTAAGGMAMEAASRSLNLTLAILLN
jgi:hypothetical protein